MRMAYADGIPAGRATLASLQGQSGPISKDGTMVDATLSAAPSSPEDKGG